MSAQRLANSATAFPAFAVVGQYCHPRDNVFVRHAAILREQTPISFNQRNVPVWHMGPPLVVGLRSEQQAGQEAACDTHVAGTIELESPDIEGIKTWLAEVEKEDRRYGKLGSLKQYIVKPHMDWERAAETNRRLYRKFSCAGFVVECYKSVGINLVRLPEEALPEVDLNTVLAAYPEAGREQIRSRYGIPGPGPWRVLLAGYLFHSLARAPAAIRTTPHTPADVREAFFPILATEDDKPAATPTSGNGEARR